MENREVAKILRDTAQLLEIDGAIIGRYRSYEKVAELLYSIPERIEDLAKDEKKLKELPGVGDSMAEHIHEILDTGDYRLRQKLLKKYPTTLLDLLSLQSLGPKKVAFLWSHFKVATVEGVAKLAREGKLRDLPGFGEKSEQNILKAAEQFKHLSGSGRVRLNVADDEAQKLAAYIAAAGESVESVTPAGSLRRGKETVGDLDLLVTMRPGHDKQKDIDACRRAHPEISRDRSATGARGEQGQLHSGPRLAGGRPAAREKELRRGATLFHRLEGTQRRAARTRERHGLDAQRIRAHHAQRRAHGGRQDRGRNLREAETRLYRAGTARDDRRNRGRGKWQAARIS